MRSGHVQVYTCPLYDSELIVPFYLIFILINKNINTFCIVDVSAQHALLTIFCPFANIGYWVTLFAIFAPNSTLPRLCAILATISCHYTGHCVIVPHRLGNTWSDKNQCRDDVDFHSSGIRSSLDRQRAQANRSSSEIQSRPVLTL